MPNYLNPTIIELDDVNFEKIDFEPGTAVFKSADFAILDAGSMQKLNITVDRDGERYIKQLQGICYVDKWAIARNDDLVDNGDGPITDDLAPVTGVVDSRETRGTYDYPSAWDSTAGGRYAAGGADETAAADFQIAQDLLIMASDAGVQQLRNTTQLEPLEHAYKDAVNVNYLASYRGEMRLSTRTAALKRGYEFYDPFDPGYDGAAAATTGDTTHVEDAYKQVHGKTSVDGAGTYEFLTEPKFKEDVYYIVDKDDTGLKYRAASDNTAYTFEVDDSGNKILFEELPGIQTTELPDNTGSSSERLNAPSLTQSNNIMHINISRNERDFDIEQSSEAVDQRRERGTRNIISSIVFCQMVSRLFNTQDGDANLQLQNVDFSSEKERQSGLFFVNIDDSDVVQTNGEVIERVTAETIDAGRTQNYPAGYADWIGLLTRRSSAYTGVTVEDGGAIGEEDIAQYALRLEFLRDPYSTDSANYNYSVDQFGNLTDDGFVLNYERDSSGNIIYEDSSGVRGIRIDDNAAQIELPDGTLHTIGGTLTAVNEEVKKVIAGSGKDRTFTIANDILYKTLQAFNGEKRGRRALDEDGNHGKKYTFTNPSDETVTAERTIENYQPSEWFPPENAETVSGTEEARVNGDKLDGEVEYWNFRTVNAAADESSDAAAGDGNPTYEKEYVPFNRNDKMMVYYTIDIFFQQRNLEEVSPDGLNALTVEGSTKVETGDVVTNKGRSPDFQQEKLNFVLEWVLTHSEQEVVSKRNAAESGYYEEFTGSADSLDDLMRANGAIEKSRKNVWVEGGSGTTDYWKEGSKPHLSYTDAIKASHGEDVTVQYDDSSSDSKDLPSWADPSASPAGTPGVIS